jgi:hypothetical protein
MGAALVEVAVLVESNTWSTTRPTGRKVLLRTIFLYFFARILSSVFYSQESDYSQDLHPITTR